MELLKIRLESLKLGSELLKTRPESFRLWEILIVENEG